MAEAKNKIFVLPVQLRKATLCDIQRSETFETKIALLLSTICAQWLPIKVYLC